MIAVLDKGTDSSVVEHRSANPKVLGSNPGAGFLVRNTSHLPLHSPPSIKMPNVYDNVMPHKNHVQVCVCKELNALIMSHLSEDNYYLG